METPNTSDMSLLENRLALVNRYNHVVGPGNKKVTDYQSRFIQGLLSDTEVVSFVRLCKHLIASMEPFKYRRSSERT